MSFRSLLLLILFLPVILRILNTRSQFRIESRIRIRAMVKKNPPHAPCTNHALPARVLRQKRGKRSRGTRRQSAISSRRKRLGAPGVQNVAGKIRRIARDKFPDDVASSLIPHFSCLVRGSHITQYPTEKNNATKVRIEINHRK